ncbi:MAG: glycosyltransferase family 2 protein [Muribaculaceae bacterium]|nr:glycosyltransferase family 2 protein [Muribaculaceae bacterium]
MKLSVVIVSYNVKHYVVQCLLSLRRALQGINAEVIVVDNHSHDGTIDMLREQYPEVLVVASNHNLGFARANNIAIGQSDSEYVLLLNPDTVVAEETIAECLQFMEEHPRAGGLGVRMLMADGNDAKESRRGLPTPAVAFYKMSGLCARFPQSRRFGHYYMGYLPWDEPAKIEVISGAFCFMRRAALNEVGFLDEDFFMYGEDIDLSYRLLKGGYENWYLPSRILHYKGESTQKSSFRYVHVFYDAMLIFFRKHYAHASLFFSIPIKAAIYGRAFVELCRMQLNRARRSMGFVSKHASQPAFYVFIGTAKHLEMCRKLAAAKGLDAQFVEGNEEQLPDGHLNMSLPSERDVYVVYDIEAYRFHSIFRIFSSRPVEWVAMGTFLPKEQMIITTEEVIR